MDRSNQLEEEIRLMALDNILTEKTLVMVQKKMEALNKDMRVPVEVRKEIYETLSDAMSFWQAGHESLKGLTDAGGNPINV